jgi:ribosome-associated toxin RatA of RatAB toxin-antitoxin module
MPIIHHELVVPHSAAQMFALVNNVDAYSEFLPYCKSSRILSRTADEVKAILVLAGGGLQKSFTTSNRLQPDDLIEIKLVEGPFKHLAGCWRFEALAQTCKISLDLEFEFSSKLLALAFGPVFNQVANTLVDAFCKRAQVVYGQAS